jgi:MFS superfamily sulfate permease-like transporter
MILSFKRIKQDLPASIVVFLVALPLCLGVAVASGAAPVTGLIAGMVGGIVVGLLSGSPLSVSGPAAGLTAIVASALEKLPSYEVFLAAVVLAGVIQLILGFAKAGLIGDFIPNAVIRGMLAAIGIILILKQLPHLVGYHAALTQQDTLLKATPDNSLITLYHAFSKPLLPALLIGLLSLCILLFFEKKSGQKNKFITLIPAPLVVVLAGIVVNALYTWVVPEWQLETTHLVQLALYDNAVQFFSSLPSPQWSGLLLQETMIIALSLALVASIESLLCLEAVDKMDPEKRLSPTNRELKAQGVGNIVSGLLGGLPVTSVIVRSSANLNAGAKTKLSGILHGLWLLLCVLFIPAVLNLIPLASLAAILIYTGYQLAPVKLFTAHYKAGFNQFIPFIVTVVAILLTNLLIGILIGIAIGFLFVLRRNFKFAITLLQDQQRFIFRFGNHVPYLNKATLKEMFEAIPDNASVMIDANQSEYIDPDIIDLVNDFATNAGTRGIRVYFKYSSPSEKNIFAERQPIETH